MALLDINIHTTNGEDSPRAADFDGHNTEEGKPGFGVLHAHQNDVKVSLFLSPGTASRLSRSIQDWLAPCEATPEPEKE